MRKNITGRTDTIRARVHDTAQSKKAALIKKLREKEYALKYLLRTMELSRSAYYHEIEETNKILERNTDISSEYSLRSRLAVSARSISERVLETWPLFNLCPKRGVAATAA